MYVVANPPPEFSPWIECLWELHAGCLPSWEEIVPADLSSDLVLSLGESYQRAGPSTAIELTGLHYLGIRSEPERFLHCGANHLLGVRFKPGCASQFFPWRGAALTGHLESEDAPLRPLRDATSRLIAQLESVHNRSPLLRNTEVRRAISSYLRNVRSGPRIPSCVPDSLEVIRDQRCFRVKAIARAVGVTERTLERHFRDTLGIRPKFAARLVRVDMARSRLRLGLAPASVAYECGLADQSHLCVEMRSLVGLAPSEKAFHPPICRISPRPLGQ